MWQLAHRATRKRSPTTHHRNKVREERSGEGKSRANMAIAMLRCWIPLSQSQSRSPSLYSHFHHYNVAPVDYPLKTKTSISCTPSQLNPHVRSEVSFCVGTHLIPHPRKVERGGEDAFFVSSYNGGVIAIADGVSAWAEEDVDPSLFPRELMANASCLVGDDEVNYDPQTLLKKAHAATSSTGSATVIVAMLERNGILRIANVGDCGLRVIRKGEIIFSSSPQEHYFDCPYQLSSERVGQTYIDATVDNIELLEGDTIVMGSDGLFDNVFDHEIVSTLANHGDATDAAKALANLASSHSMDTNFDSPYTVEARARGFDVPLWKKILGKRLVGGKLDDITVIVGQVVSS